MYLKVDRGPLISMIEVKWYQQMGIDVCEPTDIDINVLVSIYLYIPHSVEGI